MKPGRLLLLSGVLVVGASLPFSFSRTASWQIKQVFPGAEPYFAPLHSPDPSVAEAIRTVMPTYVRADESVGFWLSHSPERLDLHARFSQLTHLRLFTVELKRCRISNLCPAGSNGFPSIITFEDCDFSELPEDQRALLLPEDPTNPAVTNKFYIGDI